MKKFTVFSAGFQRSCLLLSLIFFVQNPLWSCSCISTSMSATHIANATLVFKGEILKKEPVPKETKQKSDSPVRPLSINQLKYTVLIKDIIRGKHQQKEIEIITNKDGASCGVNFTVGKTYYLLTYQEESKYTTNLCAQNRRVDRAGSDYKKAMRRFKRARCRKKWKNDEGKLVAKGKVRKRNPSGLWTFYHEDGSIKKQGRFVDGYKQGEWKFYRNKSVSHKYLENNPNIDLSSIENKGNIHYRSVTFEKGERVGEKYY